MDSDEPPEESIDYGRVDTLHSSDSFSRSNSWPNGSFGDSGYSPWRSMLTTSSASLRQFDVQPQDRDRPRPPEKSRQSQSSEELDIDGDLKSFDLDAESERTLDNNDLRAEIKRLKNELEKRPTWSEIENRIEEQIEAKLEARLEARIAEMFEQRGASLDQQQPKEAAQTVEKVGKLECKMKERCIAKDRGDTCNKIKGIQDNLKGAALKSSQRNAETQAMLRARNENQLWDKRDTDEQIQNIDDKLENFQLRDEKILAIENKQKSFEQRCPGFVIEEPTENELSQGASADLTSWPPSTPASD